MAILRKARESEVFESLYSLVALLLVLAACVGLSDAVAVVDVYRLIQYDLAGVPFGSRFASLNRKIPEMASMDSNNWQPAQGGGETTMDTADWRSQLPAESRQRIVNKILETLKRHLPFSGEDGLLELKKIAVRFEEKIYSAATNQSDYLRKISLKMLTMENTRAALTSNGSNPPNTVASMDSHNWRPAQGGEPTMDTTDWRSQLPPESRQRITNKILETLKRHIPFSGEDGLLELKKIAFRFEEKIYTAATNQSDYLRKISQKMLTMENNKTQNTRAALTSNGSNPPITDLSL